MSTAILSAVAIIIAAGLGALGVWASAKANAKTAAAQQAIDAAAKKAEADVSAGELALNLANALQLRLDKAEAKAKEAEAKAKEDHRRINALDDELSDVRDDLAAERVWQDEVREAWHKYDEWSIEVLHRLDKGAPEEALTLNPRPKLPQRPFRRRRRGDSLPLEE